jgi:hypothetical protein
MKNQYSISVLLPTRGRTDALTRSVKSIVNLAADKNQLQLLFALDNDDSVGLDHYQNELKPWLVEQGVAHQAFAVDPMGYIGLNRYYNGLAEQSDADWLFVWNDDAIMETQDWDNVVRKYDGEFKLLKIHTHNEHPYSIFPIWPREWYDLFGWVARHQMIDAELSQIAYMLDLIEIVDINATHDRADLTGNNNDPTQKAKKTLEGNPSSPDDFHHPGFNHGRMLDCEKIAEHLKTKGHSMDFWEQVKLGKQDPWEKLKLNDINNQCVQTVAPK